MFIGRKFCSLASRCLNFENICFLKSGNIAFSWAREISLECYSQQQRQQKAEGSAIIHRRVFEPREDDDEAHTACKTLTFQLSHRREAEIAMLARLSLMNQETFMVVLYSYVTLFLAQIHLHILPSTSIISNLSRGIVRQATHRQPASEPSYIFPDNVKRVTQKLPRKRYWSQFSAKLQHNSSIFPRGKKTNPISFL